jgi:hypothetical protein
VNRFKGNNVNILEMMLDSQNSGQIQQLANNFGISEDQIQAAMAQIVPALSQGVKKNISNESGLDSLLQALAKGNHQQYVDNPTSLTDNAAVSDGNNILGHILGSKDVSRAVADRASTNTGIDSGLLKQLLPMIASMMMGSLSKQTSGNAALSGLSSAGGSSNDALDMLGGLLDADKDGSVVDDLIGIAGKFLR